MVCPINSGMKWLVRKAPWALAVATIAAALFLLPGRTAIAPHVHDDNNYLFLAADRLYGGFGPTSIYPLAPLQLWEWRADWAFLTQWPVGYPVLLCGVRFLLRGTTVHAGQVIAVVGCAVALVGWFAWIRRVLPGGVAATLLAIVAAGSAVSTDALINPATDTIVAALLPLVLILTHRALSRNPNHDRKRAVGNKARGKRQKATDPRQEAARQRSNDATRHAFTLPQGDPHAKPQTLVRLACAGLLAGALFWIRYAAIYIPAGVGLFLCVQWIARRRIRFRGVAAFGLAAAVPVVALLLVNRALATPVSVQQQLNLGSRIGFTADPKLLTTVWWRFTDLPFYNHLWYSHWVFALAIPIGVIGLATLARSWRRAVRSLVTSPAFLLSACVVGVLFLMLITATVVFRSKFTYVDLPRYYAAVKPLYFVLFVGPLLCIPSKTVRGLACIPLLLCCSWYVQIEWPRPYQRWLAADRPFTDYGRWAVCFEPGSRDLYAWLRGQDGPELIVFSSFQDEIALETWIPANPVPEDESQLHRWVDRIRRARGISQPQILFVLDPSNHARDYFLPPPDEVIARFGLASHAAAPETIRRYVFDYPADESTLAPEIR